LFGKNARNTSGCHHVPIKTTAGGHWHGSTRNVNDTLTKISEIKENLRPPEILGTQLIPFPKWFVSNDWPVKGWITMSGFIWRDVCRSWIPR
jgi:hypothetical protein